MTQLGFAFGATLPVYRVTVCSSSRGCHAFPTSSPRWGNRTSHHVCHGTDTSRVQHGHMTAQKPLQQAAQCKPGCLHEAGGAHHVGGALMSLRPMGDRRAGLHWHLPRATPAGAALVVDLFRDRFSFTSAGPRHGGWASSKSSWCSGLAC
ncbi:hypothetical protein BKA80DRAFT_274408 [Phyllosticta citrichinensis]